MTTHPGLSLGGAMMQAPIPIVIVDQALRVADCNLALAALFGVTRPALLGFDLSSLTGTGPYLTFQRALAGENASWSGTFQRVLAAREMNGTVRAGPICDGDVVIGASAVVELAETAVSIHTGNAASRLGMSWYGTVDALWELDLATGALSLSPRLGEVLGYSTNLPTTLDAFRDLVHADDQPLIEEIFRAHDESAAEVDLELRLRDAEGTYRFFRLRAQSVRDESGRKYAGALGDVTAMHRARAAVREAETMFRALAEQSVCGSYIVDNGRIVFANERLAKMFGYTIEELLAFKDLSPLVHPSDMARMLAERQSRAPAEHRSVYQMRGLRRDRTVFFAEVHSNTVEVSGKSMVIGMVFDISERVESDHKVAEALAAAEHDRRQLRAMLEALPVGVWISDANGTLLTSNAALAKLYGGVPPRVRRENYDRYVAFHPDTGARLSPDDWALARALSEGRAIVGERIDLQRVDGKLVPILISAAPIRSADDQITGGVVALLDISEQRDAEREREDLIASLEFERKRLRAMFVAAPTILASLRGPDHIVELVNDALYAVVGRRDLLGKPLADAVPEVRNQGIIAALDRAYRTGNALTDPQLPLLLARHGEGPPETRFLNLSYIPITDERGVRAGTLINGYDVTEQVRAEQALRTSERRMRAQFQALPTPMYVFQAVEQDGARDFVLIDHSAAVVLPAASFLAEKSVVENLWRSLEGRAPAPHEIDFNNAGDKRRVALTYCAAPPDIVIIHCEDITERLRLEEQLRHSQKLEAVGQLAGGIAHDFNNLLAVISTCADFLAENVGPDDEKYVDIDEIRRAAVRAGDLTRKLLTFSRRQVLQPRSVSLDAVVESAQSMLRRVIATSIRIDFELGAGATTVHADAGQIEQVILNLAVNARDAMPKGGTLTIVTRTLELDEQAAAARDVKPGIYAALSVTDTGSGIEPEILPRLFEPFFTTKEVGRGTGLGLPTVYGVAKQFGGYVTVDSVVGSGTTFEVGFPREVVQSGATVLPRADIAGRILVVDDEPGVRALARRILERAGYDVIAVASGRAALEHASTGFDLVLTDFVMPEMNGRQLHDELSRRFPSLRVLYMSGYIDDEAVRLDENVSLLPKPFTALSLIDAVRAAMAK